MFWLLFSLVCFVYFEYNFLWGEKAILFYHRNTIFYFTRLHFSKKLNIFVVIGVTEILEIGKL